MTLAEPPAGGPYLARPALPEGTAAPAPPVTYVDVRGEGDVAVVAVRGPLDASALPACRDGLDEALRLGPSLVLVTLHDAEPTAASVPVLGLVRRRLARHDVPLRLAGVPAALADALREAGVDDLYAASERGAPGPGAGTGGRSPGEG